MKECTRVPWYVYVVELANGHLYCGVSTDVRRRVKEHNTDKRRASKACWSSRPVKLRYVSDPMSRSDALKREYAFKRLKRKDKVSFLLSHVRST